MGVHVWMNRIYRLVMCREQSRFPHFTEHFVPFQVNVFSTFLNANMTLI